MRGQAYEWWHNFEILARLYLLMGKKCIQTAAKNRKYYMKSVDLPYGKMVHVTHDS